jgi:transcriptional regulator with XRE-family HTH domain
MVFKKKNLKKTKRVCLRLKEARESAGFSLETLSKETKISKEHLIAMEECRFDDIPYAIVYQKNFLRQYAQTVSVPIEPILEQFEIEEAKAKSLKTNLNGIGSFRFQNLPGMLKTIGLSLIVLSLVSYLGWQVRAIVKPPELTVLSPRDGYVTETPSIIVNGKAPKEAQVYINGQKISTDDLGSFEETLNLSPGINKLIISAKKRHGKSTDLTRHVIVKQTNSFSLNK